MFPLIQKEPVYGMVINDYLQEFTTEHASFEQWKGNL